MSRRELYQAVKHEAHEYHEDCGFSMPELWNMVNTDCEQGWWWKRIVMEDYTRDVLRNVR